MLPHTKIADAFGRSVSPSARAAMGGRWRGDLAVNVIEPGHEETPDALLARILSRAKRRYDAKAPEMAELPEARPRSF
jgi:hypothetical protein